MIFTEKTIRVTNGESQINAPIVLYRGDKNIKLRFRIVDCPYAYSKAVYNTIKTTEASYAQLVIQPPNNSLPIFSDIAATEDGYVTFIITGEMIDETPEVGSYTFQIRLLDDEQHSRITIPEVVDGIEIREPIAAEDVTDTNEVEVAVVGYALTTAASPEDAFNAEGNYNKTTWVTGDRITAAKLNKIEQGIEGVNQKVANVNNINDTAASTTTTYSSNKIETIIGSETLNTSAQDIKGAINEVFQNASNGKVLIANAITGMGIEASPSDTFQELANKILLIVPTVYGNIIVDATNLEITEGGTNTFTVHLDQAPTNNQVINITSDNSKVTVNPSTLTFTSSNYNTTQTVTVSAEDDAIEDNGYTLTLTLSSNNVNNVVINVTVKDDDLTISWHTLTSDELNLKTVAGKKYSYSISSTEPNLIFPAQVSIDGVNTQIVYSIKFGTSDSPNTTLKRVKFEDGCTFNGNNLNNVFAYCTNLTRFEGNLGGIQKLSGTFLNDTSLKDLSNITIAGTVTDITEMCKGCSNLEKAPVIPETVTKAHFAFQNCTKLKKATVKSKTIYLNGTANTTGVEPFNNVNGITIKCYNDSQFYSDMRSRCTTAEILNKYYYEPLGNDVVTNIHCFGDSLTQGVNGSEGYPKALLDLLGTDFWVYNVSKAGYTTEQIADMMDGQLCHIKDNVIIWSGSNDGNGLTESERVAKVQTLVDKVPIGVNYLVIGLITYQYTEAVNEAFRSAFGEHFLDMHTALCSENAFTNIGETPTESDLTAIASGTLPPSLIATQHMTTMGDKAVAKIIYDKLVSNNYISI